MHLPDKTHLRRASETLLASSATPYGYTLTIWCSGALLMHYRGKPSVAEIFLFLAGALAAFTAISLVNQSLTKAAKPLSKPLALDWSGMLHWFAAGASVGVVCLVGRIASWVSWPLGSFLATALYLTIATAQLALSAVNEDRRSRRQGRHAN